MVKAKGVACSENQVARLMRLRGLRAKQERTFKTTKKRNKKHPVAPNLLDREFEAAGPDEKWLGDITYIRKEENRLYSAVLYLFSRRTVGRAMSSRMTSDLTKRALTMALEHRDAEPGLLHHSDQGSQYTDAEYQQILQDRGVEVSMNGMGSWHDRAPVESFFGAFKTECVHYRTCRTRDEARIGIFSHIEACYNRRRLHSPLDY